MHEQCLCDSEEFSLGKDEDDGGTGAEANRIFLNFTREYRHPAKDRYNQEKVRQLFKYLRERSDLQEMKVSGWLDGKDETEEDSGKSKPGRDSSDRYDDDLGMDEDSQDSEECKNGGESCYGSERSRRGGGQRFAMSRDFWYRKLNTLKAQKLDEAALEAEDIPPNGKSKPPRCVRYIANDSLYADQVPQKNEHMFEEIAKFQQQVNRRREQNLNKSFVNVYDNRSFFQKDPRTCD